MENHSRRAHLTGNLYQNQALPTKKIIINNPKLFSKLLNENRLARAKPEQFPYLKSLIVDVVTTADALVDELGKKWYQATIDAIIYLADTT